MPKGIWQLLLLSLIVLAGCATATEPTLSNATRVSESLNLSRSRVAVLSFASAPDHPETGRFAQEIVIGRLVQDYGISLASPSKVEAYMRDHNVIPSEFDPELLQKIGQDLDVEIVIWGRINQFTPYRFDRLVPATPPYVELTLYGCRKGNPSVAKVSGRKQGGLPATIWNRQPTFEDVAQPLIAELLSRMK